MTDAAGTGSAGALEKGLRRLAPGRKRISCAARAGRTRESLIWPVGHELDADSAVPVSLKAIGRMLSLDERQSRPQIRARQPWCGDRSSIAALKFAEFSAGLRRHDACFAWVERAAGWKAAADEALRTLPTGPPCRAHHAASRGAPQGI